jgi:O-antigen ligase
VLCLVVVPLLPERGLYRLQRTGTDITSGGFLGRVPVWREGIDLFTAHPFQGVGGGAFRAGALDTRKVAHNFVVALLAEVGLIGLGLFAMLLILVFVSAW